MKRKHADLAIQYFSDDSVEMQRKVGDGPWIDDHYPQFCERYEYRKKQKTIKYRVVLMNYQGESGRTYIDIEQFDCQKRLSLLSYFKKYLTDWIEIEV